MSGLSILDVRAGIRLQAATNALRLKLLEHWDSPRRWEIIRTYYAEVTPRILAGYRLDPYALGLGDKMTPIEFALWQEIRYHGLPFYPQYPVGRRFVDFGDPVYRIAVEADGAAYHSKERDELRDFELKREGWRVFHITGRVAFTQRRALAPVLLIYGIVLEDEDEE